MTNEGEGQNDGPLLPGRRGWNWNLKGRRFVELHAVNIEGEEPAAGSIAFYFGRDGFYKDSKRRS